VRNEPDVAVCDSEAARLLPWLVTGRLDADDAARVEAHISTCPICRADWGAQHGLRELVRSDDGVEYAPQPSLQKLMSRIDELDRELAPVTAATDAAPAMPRSTSALPRWLIAALVVQTFGLGLLGTALWRHSSTEPTASASRYETLTSAPVSTDGRPQLRVVFAPGTTLAELADLLGSVHGTIVSGPSEAGAYTVAVPGDRARPEASDAPIVRLRTDRRVLFAEPVVRATGPR